jgi:peptidoglycan hydrolase-like protein with peptidoglycan-binding domain
MPWPTGAADQVRAIQRLLVELKLMNVAPTGTIGPLTRRAIRDYQRTAGLKETGEASQALFESLKEARMRETAKAGR